MLAVYTITIFLSAVLLFVVQPMFARMIVPLLGGSPSVWNTAMLFYQATLLAGYAYAHFGTKWLGLRRQIICHLVLLALVFLALPLGVPAGWSPPTQSNPVYWLLGLMCLSVGLPFFVLSSTSPLIQKWFASTGHRSASDPYFLYAASNAGSLLALAAYPFVIEPIIGLGRQSRLWSVGYGLLAALIGACAYLLWQSLKASKPKEAELGRGEKMSAAAAPIGRRRKARWVALAFVPSSLMLSLTTYLSSEVASAPLLWVFPLTIYLLTFTLVFARRRLIPHTFLLRMFPIGVIALTQLLTMRATNPFFLLALVHLGMFFVAAMVCHGEIANDRPEAEHLTEYYLWMSIGGVLGGVFNALVAPIVFNSIAEYPLVLVAACFLVVKTVSGEGNRFRRWLDVVLPLSLAMLTFVLIYFVPRLVGVTSATAHALIFAPPVALCFFLSERRVRFGLGVACIFAASFFYGGETGKILFSDRSFYGVHRVTIDQQGKYYLLIHGTTVHGMQHVEREELPMPLSYYHPRGPAGEFFFRFKDRLKAEIDRPVAVAAIGMGAGALASYGQTGQKWTFYEIDPVVSHLAQDSEYFDYLRKSKADVNVILGDGRLSLGAAPDGEFQLIIVDAFSSDVIPVHLLTREALALYVRKLRPDGAILFHISNRHFNLKPILADLSLEAGLVCLHRDGTYVAPTADEEGKDPSEWIVIARRDADIAPIARNAQWNRFRDRSGDVIWTDDLSSLLDVLF